jgi:spore coat polysaccharide biosynthesis predicted glycosyltransferase SpsG
MSERRKITVRVDSSHTLGMGHVMRCIHLANHLKHRSDLQPEIEFITIEDKTAIRELEKYGTVVHPPFQSDKPYPTPNEYDGETLPRMLRTSQPDIFILDCNWENHPEFIDLLPNNLAIISLHEHNFQVLQDLAAAINPSLVEQIPPPGGEIGKTHFQGPDFLMIDEGIPDLAQDRDMELNDPIEVVVCFGGSDPDAYTIKAVNALTGVKGIHIRVIVGPAFSNEIYAHPLNTPGIVTHDKPSRIAPILTTVDLSIVNAATTMFESIALGVPTIAIPRNPYETIQAGICHKAGAAFMVKSDDIEKEVPPLIQELTSNAHLRNSLSHKGKQMIDAKGLSRVGDIIVTHLTR